LSRIEKKQRERERGVCVVEAPTAADMYRTPTAVRSSMCAGRVVQDRSRQQQKNGPVGRLFLWKEWNTRTAVDGKFVLSFQNETVLVK
jgi:hypothetical protein